MDYYKVLGIERSADQSQIKKAYHQLAKKYHPDKCQGDLEAEERFKEVTEAYTVLSDESKKVVYDSCGKEGVKKVNDPIDPFRVLFGGGSFDDTFGELFFLNSLVKLGSAAVEEESIKNQIAKNHQQQKESLAQVLIEKISHYNSLSPNEFHAFVSQDCVFKSQSPSGAALLKIVGSIYVEKAKQSMGRFFGLEGLISNIMETGSKASQALDVFSSTLKLRQLHEEYFDGGDQQDNLTKEKYEVVWSLGKAEISRIVEGVCQTVLYTTSSSVQTHRATALRMMGDIYTDIGEKVFNSRKKDTEFDVPDLNNLNTNTPSSPHVPTTSSTSSTSTSTSTSPPTTPLSNSTRQVRRVTRPNNNSTIRPSASSPSISTQSSNTSNSTSSSLSSSSSSSIPVPKSTDDLPPRGPRRRDNTEASAERRVGPRVNFESNNTSTTTSQTDITKTSSTTTSNPSTPSTTPVGPRRVTTSSSQSTIIQNSANNAKVNRSVSTGASRGRVGPRRTLPTTSNES
eukprot:TRINITY_DN6812_c0_g2_i1.p1 TRINITY_DN6812_c0_g2~~TRINITY_DN6812_c0_g2_i1.p1  ORF type:complete len:512 (-),score=128.00 TRINITY_DN6812_c0_g2_i1:160-1695(-)